MRKYDEPIFDVVGAAKELKWPWYVWVWVAFCVLFLIGSISNGNKIYFYHTGIAMYGFMILKIINEWKKASIKDTIVSAVLLVVIGLPLAIAGGAMLTMVLNIGFSIGN